MTEPLRKVSLDMSGVHNLSLELLELLEDARVDSDLAVASCALTLVRLCSPMRQLSIDEEIKQTTDLIGFSQMAGSVSH